MFLEETIASIIGQTYKNIEYIVIDGNSIDATVSIIKKYSQYIAYWVSEEDAGMYEAINKGLKRATGDYILVLNSDDVLVNKKVIEDVVSQISLQRLDYYYGNIVKVNGGNSKKVKVFNISYRELLYSTHGTFAPHPCFFISALHNKKIAGYNVNYKYASDYDYILRALKIEGARGEYMDIYITRFRVHNGSITSSGKIEQDRLAILKQHGFNKKPYLLKSFFYYTLWVYYKIINIGHCYKSQ